MFNSFPQPKPDGGVSAPSWMNDWSAYQTVMNWTGSIVSAAPSSWNTFVDITKGAGWLNFVRAFSSDAGQAENPDVRVTIDGVVFLFNGNSTFGYFNLGNIISQPVYFSSSLKIEVFNRHTTASNLGCDSTYLLKTTTPNPSKQTILLSSSRNEAYNFTTSTTLVDVVNITGSGYLLAIEYAGNTTASGTTSLGSTITLDSVIKMNNRKLVSPGNGSNKQHFFNGPIRFTNSLRVQHLAEATAITAQTRVFYTLD